MCGTALGAAAFESPASAQKEKKSKPKYSKKFQKAYAAAVPLVNAEPVDEAALRAAIPTLQAASSTPDDMDATGNIMLSAGGKLDDQQLRLQGIQMMIDSGQNADRAGLLQYAKYQIQQGLEDMEGARASLLAASAAGYSFEGQLSDGTSQTVGPEDIRVMVSQTYFDNDQYAAGLADLKGYLESRMAQGQPVKEDWLRRGFSVAFNNELGTQATEFSELWLQNYPSANVWGDAITVQTRFFEYDSQEALDILRLARRTGVLSADRLDASRFDANRLDLIKMSMERLYLDYGEAADYRRFPGEVKEILEMGIAEGILDANGVTVSDWLGGARSRVNADKADLPSLERDARSSSSVTTVMAAGDAFLSYGQAAKAEEFYTKALTLPGVDADRMMTRLGIAQTDLGKYTEAQATFAKVGGKRASIARLWSVHAGNMAGAQTSVAAAPANDG